MLHIAYNTSSFIHGSTSIFSKQPNAKKIHTRKQRTRTKRKRKNVHTICIIIIYAIANGVPVCARCSQNMYNPFVFEHISSFLTATNTPQFLLSINICNTHVLTCAYRSSFTRSLFSLPLSIAVLYAINNGIEDIEY